MNKSWLSGSELQKLCWGAPSLKGNLDLAPNLKKHQRTLAHKKEPRPWGISTTNQSCHKYGHCLITPPVSRSENKTLVLWSNSKQTPHNHDRKWRPCSRIWDHMFHRMVETWKRVQLCPPTWQGELNITDTVIGWNTWDTLLQMRPTLLFSESHVFQPI